MYVAAERKKRNSKLARLVLKAKGKQPTKGKKYFNYALHMSADFNK